MDIPEGRVCSACMCMDGGVDIYCVLLVDWILPSMNWMEDIHGWNAAYCTSTEDELSSPLMWRDAALKTTCTPPFMTSDGSFESGEVLLWKHKWRFFASLSDSFSFSFSLKRLPLNNISILNLTHPNIDYYQPTQLTFQTLNMPDQKMTQSAASRIQSTQVSPPLFLYP